MFPSARDVEYARAAANQTLTSEARVFVYSSAPDGAGGTNESYTGMPGTVNCRIAPLGGGEGGSVGARVDARTTHVLTFPAGTAVTASDRVNMENRVYEVTAVRVRSNEITRRVEAREL
jgi:hypothetical protein